MQHTIVDKEMICDLDNLVDSGGKTNGTLVVKLSLKRVTNTLLQVKVHCIYGDQRMDHYNVGFHKKLKEVFQTSLKNKNI